MSRCSWCEMTSWFVGQTPVLLSALVLLAATTTVAARKDGDPGKGSIYAGLNCNFEGDCSWVADPPNRFWRVNGKKVRDFIRNHPKMNYSGPISDESGSQDGHFLLTSSLDADDKRDPNTTLALRSPLLNYTGPWCTLSMSVHSSWEESPVKVVVQDADQKTVIDFGHHKTSKSSAYRWSPMSTQISHHRKPFRIVLEVAPPTQELRKKTASHVAIDNIRFEDCGSDDSIPKKCSPPRDFVCRNGRCLSSDHVCDFVKDCPEGEDEKEGCEGMAADTRCDFEAGLCGWKNGTNNVALGFWALKQVRHYHAARKLPMFDHSYQNQTGHCLIYDEPSDGKFGAQSSVRSETYSQIPFYHALNTSLYFESCRVRFYYFLAGQNVGALSLHVTAEGSSNKSVEIWSHQQETKDRWLRASFPLPTTMSERYHLEFLAQRGLRHNSILAIDDISLSKECFGVGVPENETRIWPPQIREAPDSVLEYRFSTCGASGRLGPNQDSCSASYGRTSTRVSLNQGNFTGIQLWKTPHTGYYTVIAKGASGGMGSGNYELGKSRGAIVTTIVYLLADQPVHILVGQEGANGPDIKSRRQLMMVLRRQDPLNETSYAGAGGGGGGGTFIFQTEGPRTKALAIAAGGGGSQMMTADDDSFPNIHGRGLHEGDQQPQERVEENFTGHGGGWSGHQPGPGSAGSLMDGASGGKPCSLVLSVSQDAFAAVHAEGGFGGGGGGCFGGGGGGGYYGGRGGDGPKRNGEGGWSYAVGSDIHVEPGMNEGPGEVIILPALRGEKCGCEHQCLPLSTNRQKFRCLCPSHLYLASDGRSCSADLSVTSGLDLAIVVPLCILGVSMVCVICALIVSIYQRIQKRRHRLMVLGTGRSMSGMALNRMGAPLISDHSGMTPMSGPPPMTAATVMMDSNMVTEYNPNYEFGGICSLQDLKTVTRDRLSLVKGLGQGAFGEVYQGYLKGDDGSETAVAVKTLPELSSNQASMDFLMEALIMAQFSHPNIVKFIGVSFECSPKFIVLELLAGGDLKTFLRESRPTPERPSPITMKDLLLCARDVAEGCRYLEENHFIHRDIAARNCLLTTKAPGRVVKIADFGMARDIYRADYYRKGGKAMLPVKWMPPEAFLDGVFTSKTDVWSFGILLWEVMSLGYMPYPGRGNQEVMEIVSSGGRLESPPRCPSPVYRIMDQCWAPAPDQRPNFVTILERIGYCLQDPDVINTQLPICSGLMTSEMDTTIIRPPPSSEGSLPCLSLARGIGRTHSLSSSGAQSSHRSGGSGASMTIGYRSVRNSSAARSDYMVPRNASSGALASKAEDGTTAFVEGEITRQRSVPYNLQDGGSTERLLGDSYQQQRNGGLRTSELRGSNPQIGRSDNPGSAKPMKRQTRSQRSHSGKGKDRSERRNDRSRSQSRSRVGGSQNAMSDAGVGAVAVSSNGPLSGGALRESDSSQPLLGLHAQTSCEALEMTSGTEAFGGMKESSAVASLKSTPSKRKSSSGTAPSSGAATEANHVGAIKSGSEKSKSSVALDPSTLPQATGYGVVRFTANSVAAAARDEPSTSGLQTTPLLNSQTDASSSSRRPYVVTAPRPGKQKPPLKENEISV